MKGRQEDPLLRLQSRLLKLFPHAFREEFGDSCLDTLNQRLKRSRSLQGPRLALWKCLLREGWGLCRAGMEERFRDAIRSRRTRKKEQSGMKSMRLDLRQAVRRLRSTPGFSLTVIATLTLAIGASASLFTLVNRVLLRPLPFPDSQELVEMRHIAPGIGTLDLDQTRGTFFHYQRNSRSFVSMALYVSQPVNLSGPDNPQRVRAAVATSSLFQVLQTPPLLGRVFNRQEGLPGGDLVTVLSYGLWRRSFGADPEIIGREIRVAGASIRVVGVMPERFVFPDAETELWIPFQLDPNSPRFGGFSERAVGRLRPGITPLEAQSELNRLVMTLPEAYPNGPSAEGIEEIGLGVNLHPLKDYRTRSVAQVLWVLLGSVLILLLIAFLNVGNLFLVRAESRGSEVAVRQALGAGIWDIVRSFLIETLLVSLIAGALALAVSYWGIQWLRLYGPEQLPRMEEMAIDSSTVLLCLGLSFLAALLLTGMSCLRRRLSDLTGSLKDSGRGAARGLRSRSQKILVGVQVALALVLLISAALMTRTLLELQGVDPGFDPEGRLTFRLSLPSAQYPDRTAAAAFHRRLIQEFSTVPGVLAVGTNRCLPLSGWCGGDPLAPEGQVNDTITPPVALKPINPDYFMSMGIRLLSGRSLTWADQDDATGAAVVTETLTRQYWPDQDPLGKRFRIGVPGREGNWATVVGVVEEIRMTGLRDEPGKIVYFPLINHPGIRNSAIHDMTYVVRVSGKDPLVVLPALRSRLAQLDPELPMADIRTLREVLQAATTDEAFAALILFVLAVTANLMGALGLYGAMSYLIAQRTSEIGLRMALGASVRDVGWMILKEAGIVVLGGLAVGLLASLAATRFLESTLFGVSPNDPATYVSVALLLLLIGLAAAYVPARRASLLEPAQALHWE